MTSECKVTSYFNWNIGLMSDRYTIHNKVNNVKLIRTNNIHKKDNEGTGITTVHTTLQLIYEVIDVFKEIIWHGPD